MAPQRQFLGECEERPNPAQHPGASLGWVQIHIQFFEKDSIASTVLEENLIDNQNLHPRVKDVQIYTHSFEFLTMPMHNNTSFYMDLFWMMFSADRAKISSFSLLKIYKRHFAATLYNATIYLLQVFLKHDCAVWNFKCGNKICFEMSDIHSIEQIKAFYDFDMKKILLGISINSSQ